MILPICLVGMIVFASLIIVLARRHCSRTAAVVVRTTAATEARPAAAVSDTSSVAAAFVTIALPATLKAFFFLYPLIVNKAFEVRSFRTAQFAMSAADLGPWHRTQAFSCYTFDNGTPSARRRYLMSDVRSTVSILQASLAWYLTALPEHSQR